MEVKRTVGIPITCFELLHSAVQLEDVQELAECFAGENNAELIALTLVKMQGAHVAWKARWQEITPAWLVTIGSIKVVDEDDLRRLQLLPESKAPAPVTIKEPPPEPVVWPRRRLLREMPRLLEFGWLSLKEKGDDLMQLMEKGPLALRSDLLELVNDMPHLLGHLPSDHTGHSFALDALQQYDDLFRFLPEAFKEDRYFLFEAFTANSALREEFLATAGKSEINEFYWRLREEEQDHIYARRNARRFRFKRQKK